MPSVSRKQAVCHPERAYMAKGLCRQCYNAQPRFVAMEKKRRQARGWREAGINLTQEQYYTMLERQHGLCAICGKPPITKSLAPDHDHTTGKLRDLLCLKCNTALGLLDHDSRRCIKAAQYLAAYERDQFLGT